MICSFYLTGSWLPIRPKRYRISVIDTTGAEPSSKLIKFTVQPALRPAFVVRGRPLLILGVKTFDLWQRETPLLRDSARRTSGVM